jgi:hypothetical protein
MKTTMVVYGNGDDALLMWTVDRLDPHCLGFAVQRKLKRGGTQGAAEWLDNWARPGLAEHQNGVHQSSEAWPFRTFSWTDHSVKDGDIVSYRMVPVLSGSPAARLDLASDWTRKLRVGVARNAKYVPSFNRGFVISQFVSRYLDEHYPGLAREKALTAFKQRLNEDGNDLEDRFRVFLAGPIRAAMLGLLDDVDRAGDHLHAALFELSDHELIAALAKLGPRAHVVLANGAITPKKGVETAAQARKRDENADARKALRHAGVDVHDRFVAPKPLAHNKFAVVVTPVGTATAVWTGSTNWTPTGLCTQLNNGLLVRDRGVAAAYLAQWSALSDAKGDHPAALTQGNATPTAVGADTPGMSRATVHFTRAPDRVDLGVLKDIIMGAKHGVLFLMFQPGGSGTLADVRALAAARPRLLVRGVVSTLPKGPADEQTGPTTTLRVSLVGGRAAHPVQTATVEVIQPRNLPHPAAGWAVETTREQFRNNIGYAIIHSKVLVVDPFSDDPTVVTGSHNFSISASEDNDENFLVVRGDRPLAEAYAVNIESAWRHYAGRMSNPHARMAGTGYLQALLDDQRRQQAFWGL